MTDDADMERRLAQVRRNVIAYAESHPRQETDWFGRIASIVAFGCLVAVVVAAVRWL
jgi:hypothetical protein